MEPEWVDIKNRIIFQCQFSQVNSNLVLSIAEHESGLNPYVTRFEPKWSYFLRAKDFAKLLLITEGTEMIYQAISWGPLQVMGSVCRELGYDDHLNILSTDSALAIELGVKKIISIMKKYSNMEDIISSYNQGSPVKDLKGQYKNQSYVDDVLKRYLRR